MDEVEYCIVRKNSKLAADEIRKLGKGSIPTEVLTVEPLIMKSTKVQTSPIILYRSHALEHLPQSTEPRAVLVSEYVMAKPTQFVKLSERVVSSARKQRLTRQKSF